MQPQASPGQFLQQQPPAVGELLVVGWKARDAGVQVDHERTDLRRRILRGNRIGRGEQREQERCDQRQ